MSSSRGRCGHAADRARHRIVIFNSRWLLAPFYLGLIVGLVLLFVHFVTQLAEFVLHIRGAAESEVILGILSLIDLTFTANLVVIVIFSGYENFVSSIETDDRSHPAWMTKVDFGGLKQKLMTSIVAISAIKVLEVFMNLDKSVDNAKLAWLVGIQVVFVISMLVLAIVDRLSTPSDQK
jgi:uncharacterized protein (TIGR00645 family)